MSTAADSPDQALHPDALWARTRNVYCKPGAKPDTLCSQSRLQKVGPTVPRRSSRTHTTLLLPPCHVTSNSSSWDTTNMGRSPRRGVPQS
jgi:hypothetical protein